MLLNIHPDNPDTRKINMVIKCLQKGGVMIFPTDTVYAMGCDIHQPKAVDRIIKIKGIELKKANFSFICYDLSHISDYVFSVDTPVYRVMRKALPGPYTFILKANGNVPKLFHSKKKTIGLRVPGNNIAREIVKELGNPIMATSIHGGDELIDYIIDPEIIHEKFENQVDIVINGGFSGINPSTVIDCSDGEINLVRQGLGDFNEIT